MIASEFDFLGKRSTSTNEYRSTSEILGNAKTLRCVMYNSTAYGQDECLEYVKYDYWFAIATLVFIYLPSINVVVTLYGPKTAGKVAMKVSLGMAVVGGIIAFIGLFMSNLTSSIIGWYIVILSGGILGMGLFNYFSNIWSDFAEISLISYLVFIPILVISPAIFIGIKLLAIFKSGNTLLQSQSTFGSRGEGILEAAPQLGLQLYIVMLSLKPTQNQVLSILTSVATLSLPNIENYVASRGGEFGFKPIIKNIWLFLPASLFKILSISLLAVFLRGWVILVIVLITALMLWVVVITSRCYNFSTISTAGDDLHIFECILLSWLTLGGLGSSRDAAVHRLFSTLTVTIIYSLILVIIMIICNVDPDSGYVYVTFELEQLLWSELHLVKDPFTLNIVLASTIGLGWISYLLDIIIAWCKSHDWRSYNWGPLSKVVKWFLDPLDKEVGFWDEAVLLQGLGVKKKSKNELTILDLK